MANSPSAQKQALNVQVTSVNSPAPEESSSIAEIFNPKTQQLKNSNTLSPNTNNLPQEIDLIENNNIPLVLSPSNTDEEEIAASDNKTHIMWKASQLYSVESYVVENDQIIDSQKTGFKVPYTEKRSFSTDLIIDLATIVTELCGSERRTSFSSNLGRAVQKL